jgi:hypothetical protein
MHVAFVCADCSTGCSIHTDANKEIVNLTNRLAINFRDSAAVKRALDVLKSANVA